MMFFVSSLVVGRPLFTKGPSDTFLKNVKGSPPFNLPEEVSILQVCEERVELELAAEGLLDQVPGGEE